MKKPVQPTLEERALTDAIENGPPWDGTPLPEPSRPWHRRGLVRALAFIGLVVLITWWAVNRMLGAVACVILLGLPSFCQ